MFKICSDRFAFNRVSQLLHYTKLSAINSGVDLTGSAKFKFLDLKCSLTNIDNNKHLSD